MIALLISMFLPTSATCPVGFYVNGVRPSGVYSCRSAPPRERAWEHDGILDHDDPVEVGGWITCLPGQTPIVTGPRSVGCR